MKCKVVHAAFYPPYHSREQEHSHVHNAKHLETTTPLPLHPLPFVLPTPHHLKAVYPPLNSPKRTYRNVNNCPCFENWSKDFTMDDEPWESIPWDFDDYLEDSDAPWMEPHFRGDGYGGY